MSLSGLDLNLVLSLRALLEERNVTRAGQRVGLSQPAMSAALARLRRHFDDDLLSRVGKQYELTALGRALLNRTSTACDLLERVFVRHGGLAEAAPAARDGGVTARLREYLEAHYAEAVSLERLAGLLQRHPRHLIEAFRRAYGVPPHTYLLQRRVREAKRLLLDGQAPLEVALALGFYDQAHFGGTFKRFTGVSPGRFRAAAAT